MASDSVGEPRDPAAPTSPARPDPGMGDRRWVLWLTIFFSTEVLAVAVFQDPLVRFDRFAIFDSGGELAIQDMLRRGYQPTVDFGYQYGLLPLLLGRLWYGVAGLTPVAFRAEAMACMILSAWGLARFAVYRRVGPVGVVLIAAAIPDLMLVSYLTLVQILEQALLVSALAEQARGRHRAALALLTACVFVKPALAFVQGLAVVIAIVAANRRFNRVALARDFGPSLITAVVLAAILAVGFGPVAVARTCLPLTGMEAYRLANFGFFFGIGRDFWLLPHAGLRDYFRYEVGFWLLGTAFLVSGALFGLRRLARGDSSDNQAGGDEIVATCAVVHIVFVVFLFGHRTNWLYSLPMLILGLAALASRGRRHRAVLWVLAALLLVSDRSKAVDILRRWRTDAPSAATLNLWADSVERAEWQQAQELTRGRQPVLVAMCDGGALLIPGFASPSVGYLIPGIVLPVEVERKAAQLATAPMIIAAASPWPGLEVWPALAATLDGCELVMEGRFLRVYRRVAPPAPASSTVR